MRSLLLNRPVAEIIRYRHDRCKQTQGDTPVKGGIPASANQQGYLETKSSRIWKAYQLRQRLLRQARAGIPACLLFTSVSERNKHAKPNTVTNRMATYRVRAGSIVEPCGRVFHRVEQSPESKECQHLQPAPGGACQIARHMPPLPTSNAVGLASYSRSQPTTDRPTDAVPTLALSPHSFPVGQQGKPLPSSLPSSLCGVQS